MRALCLALLLLAGQFALTIDGPIALDSGQLAEGMRLGGGMRVYRGVPFAAPPVGALRWREPQPVPSWQGQRDSSRFAPSCVQLPSRSYLNPALIDGSPPLSEDCLYLNVWSPAAGADEHLPVLVWVHGGAFTDGAGSMSLYDGAALARKGAVVVTLNYRLGAFGFMAHPALTEESPHGASGNYGLMDMLAALRWVQRNIAVFGGDPSRVTLAGQSAGAMAIAALVASPLSQDLFHRVIAQSGGWMGLGPGYMRTRSSAEAEALQLAGRLNVVTTQQLRQLDTEEVALSLRGAGLISDGWIVPEDASKVFAAGRQLPVDVLVGSNADEGAFMAPVTVAAWREQLAARWSTMTPAMLKLYPADDDASATRSAQQAFRDGASWHMRLFASYQARLGAKAWVYRFDHRPAARDDVPALGAVHSAELPYVFNNLKAQRLYPDSSAPELAAEQDVLLAERIGSYWVNFAASGDPNSRGQVAWPAWRNMNSQALVLQPAPEPETRVPTSTWLRYNQLFDKLLGN